MARSSSRHYGQYRVALSNLDKPYYPDDGVSKGTVVDYYERIAPVMVPYLRGRPLTMRRFPEGIGGESFYQKRASDYFPDWIERARVPAEDGPLEQVVVNNQATLVYLANQGAIEFHPLLSRADRVDHPDLLIFDLDPSGDDFDVVRETALELRELLLELDFVPFVKTTGSRGLHITVPLSRDATFDETRAFALRVAEILVARNPEVLTTEFRKSARGGRVFVDVLRNGYAQTAVAPYSLRAIAGAPVAAPLTWDEVEDPGLSPRRYTIANITDHVERNGDPWARMPRRARSLRSRLGRLARFERG